MWKTENLLNASKENFLVGLAPCLNLVDVSVPVVALQPKYKWFLQKVKPRLNFLELFFCHRPKPSCHLPFIYAFSALRCIFVSIVRHQWKYFWNEQDDTENAFVNGKWQQAFAAYKEENKNFKGINLLKLLQNIQHILLFFVILCFKWGKRRGHNPLKEFSFEID